MAINLRGAAGLLWEVITGRAAVAADNAGVVALHPSSPLPVGDNLLGRAKLSDGTSVMAVKAASTPAAASDPAAVVSLSPNLPVPSKHSLNSAAGTNATSVKSSAARLHAISLFNSGAAVACVHLYDVASVPTAGSGAPALPIAIPAGGNISFSFGLFGQPFTAGLAYTITGGVADADTTPVAAGQVKVLISYL